MMANWNYRRVDSVVGEMSGHELLLTPDLWGDEVPWFRLGLRRHRLPAEFLEPSLHFLDSLGESFGQVCLLVRIRFQIKQLDTLLAGVLRGASIQVIIAVFRHQFPVSH